MSQRLRDKGKFAVALDVHLVVHIQPEPSMPTASKRAIRGIVLDMDSSVSPTHGEQELSVWNGHYACTCYHRSSA